MENSLTKRFGAKADRESMRVMTTLLPSAPGTWRRASAFLVTNTRRCWWQPRACSCRWSREQCWQSAPSTLVGAVGGGSQVAVRIGQARGAAEFDPITAGDGEIAEDSLRGSQ